MKRTTYLIGATFAVLASLSSCQTSVEIESQPFQAPEIIASLETDSNTKSMVMMNGAGVGTIYWTPADRINIFYGTTSTLYTSQNTENAITAVFRTTDIIGSNELGSENIWGLYPYDENAVCDGSTVTTTIPSTQYAVPDTFDDDLFPTLAHSATNALKFYNVCGGIKFSLSRGDITQITFRGNNAEDLAGNVSLTFTNNVPAATVLSGAKEITLLPKTGDTFAQDTNYYLVLLPCTLTSGFTMTFNTSGGSVGIFNYTANAVNITRSVFSRKANIDTYATFGNNNYVQFEDDNFKAYCVQNFDTDGDGEVSYVEALEAESISVKTLNISSLKGVEYFKNITSLRCYGTENVFDSQLGRYSGGNGQLTSLDVSDNTALTYLECRYNQLTSLDISGCTALTELLCFCNKLISLDVSHNTAFTKLRCNGNQLASLDVSGCTALTSLDCSLNQLTSLDVSHNVSLTILNCDYNQLTTLDVSHNTALTYLNCYSNQLTTLDVSHNTMLKTLECYVNQLSLLDVNNNAALTTLDCHRNQLITLEVSHKTALTSLNCSSNQLSTLEVSNNTALKFLNCSSNQLSTLDISSNGASTNLDCTNNPNLTEIWLRNGQYCTYDTGIATIYWR